MWHKLKEMDMFHKALWMRNYKQGKIVIWSLWAMSFLLLPMIYLSSANMMVSWISHNFEYSYSFDYGFTLLVLGGILILLACILTGWEKANHGMDFTFTLPFKRRDIFLSKWMMGAANVAVITVVNIVFMFFIQKTTIHGAYQTFTPFLNFFLFMFVALLAIYSLALFIGTITGGFISQAFLTVGICTFPILHYGLLINFLGRHGISPNWLWGLETFFLDISPLSILLPHFRFFEEEVGGYVILFQELPSLMSWISLLVYLFASLHLGMHFYKKTPSENNGKIILFKKLEPIFIWPTIVCIALFGGIVGENLLWRIELLGYCIGFIASGIISYIILSKLMQKPLKFRKV